MSNIALFLVMDVHKQTATVVAVGMKEHRGLGEQHLRSRHGKAVGASTQAHSRALRRYRYSTC